MECLCSFLRRHFAGKPVMASGNVGCFVRVQLIRQLFLFLFSCSTIYKETLREVMWTFFVKSLYDMPIIINFRWLQMAQKNCNSTYSYFEKSCRKKCTQQSRKGLCVVLSSLFFEEIWKNGTRGHGRLFASTKGKQQKQVRQLSTSGTVHWPYPILPFGIVACTFFPTTFSK